MAPPKSKKKSSSDDGAPAQPARKKRLLIVDDNAMIRIYFRDVFWIHGMGNRYDISMADSPQSVMKILDDPAQRPDLIFLDLSMPMADASGTLKETPDAGMSVLKKIKSTPELQDIKVIIFSGYPDFKKMATDSGADGYLVKGDNLPNDLLNYVEKVMDEKQPAS